MTTAETINPSSDSQPQKRKISRSTLIVWIVIFGVSIGQGMLGNVSLLMTYIFKDFYHFQPAAMTTLGSLIGLPWVIKPLWGGITDALPIFGYRRKSYIILMSLLVWSGYFVLGLHLPAVWLAILLDFFISLGKAFQSVVFQAILIENTKEAIAEREMTAEEKQDITSKNASIYFGGGLFGRLIVTIILTILLKKDNIQFFVFVFSFTPLAVMSFALLLKEKRVKKKANALLHDTEMAANRPKPLTRKEKLRKLYRFFKHPLIFKSWIFLFLSSFTISANSANFFFYTDVLQFEPNTVASLSTVTLAATTLGLVLFYAFFKKTPIKSFFIVTSVIYMTAQVAMLALYFRLNVKWGIPDYVFVAVDSFVKAMMGELNSVPVWVLIAQLCPKGMEATVNSTMLAGSNLAGVLSEQLGALVLYLLKIGDGNFDNMWILVVIGVVTPLPSLYFAATIPFGDAIKYAGEYHDEEPASDAKKGSFNSNATDGEVVKLDANQDEETGCMSANEDVKA